MSTTTTINEREDTADPGPIKKARKKLPNKSTLLVPLNAGESLRACIQKFGLQPPFSRVDDEKFWGDYFLERSLLDFRHEHAFDSKGKEHPHQNKCIEFPESVKKTWSKLAADTPILSKYGELPAMHPLCIESYADMHDSSKTARGEYLGFCDLIQAKVTKTLEGTSLPPDIKDSMSKQVYILNYWVGWEGDGGARTVESKARLYSPIGNGESIDITWYRHFRQRMSCNGELFSSLKCGLRGSSSCPKHPTKNVFATTSLLASVECVNSYTDEKEDIRSKFCKLPVLKDAAVSLFGQELAKTISKRKVFALLARASGAYHVGGAGSWIYGEMREHFELGSGEESDEEEKSAPWWPGY